MLSKLTNIETSQNICICKSSKKIDLPYNWDNISTKSNISSNKTPGNRNGVVTF